MSKPANIINHIALLLDGSTSMDHFREEVVKVADAQIAHLAVRSTELKQETRVSVYVFGSTVECVIFDKDVLRLPSIVDLYRIQGMTALVDATMLSQNDLAKTAQMYGDHAFLTYILTDGEENASHTPWRDMAIMLGNQPYNWTVAVLVPDQTGKHEAKKFGFPADNIAIWNATSPEGVVEAGDIIRSATENFMVSRSQGIRGSRSLFTLDMGADVLNAATIKAAKLKALTKTQYTMLDVDCDYPIREWVIGKGYTFQIGKAFYQLTKAEDIQAQKAIAVVDKKTGRVYTGPQARDLLGLKDELVRVRPADNPKYDVFVQSTSVNRKLIEGTQLLLIK